MTVWFAALLGLVQGLTEFLPISSSGHLVLLQTLICADFAGNTLTLDVFLHFGTLISVVFCYASELRRLAKEAFCAMGDLLHGRPVWNASETRRLLCLLVLTTLPMGLALWLQPRIALLFESPAAVGCMLLVTALLLFLADTCPHGAKTARSATPLDALTVGVFQLCALLPGLSRSGTTIAAGRLRGFSPEFAVRFSFLASVPVILCANLVAVKDTLAVGFQQELLLPYAVGVLTAALSGILAVQFVKHLSRKSGFRGFSLYTACVGLLVILYTCFH